MKKIGIIGGGIVGMTAAYYLSEKNKFDISLYDDGNQATKAAVGIICPWLNQRRNKLWYALVRDGAEFYDQLMNDLNDDSFYKQIGGLYINHVMEDRMHEIAKKRRVESYKVGDIAKVSKATHSELTPKGFQWETGLFVSGAAKVDGELLLKTLTEASIKNGLNVYNRKVNLDKNEKEYQIDGESFDLVILAPGPYLKELMEYDSNYHVDIRAQKGQLISFNTNHTNQYPVIMPKGKVDFLFQDNGRLVVGSSHEDDFLDEEVDWEVLESLKKAATKHYPELEFKEISDYRLGFRAQNSNHTPFYGNLKNEPKVYVASGLGSSGLTSGPIIGYRLAQSILESNNKDDEYFNANDYVYLK